MRSVQAFASSGSFLGNRKDFREVERFKDLKFGVI